MKVEIRHHTGGWQAYDIEAETLGQAAYLAVRQSHHFLTDHNHTYEPRERTTVWAGRSLTFTSVWILRNENSPPYVGPKWAQTEYWLAIEYRAPGAAVISVDPGRAGGDHTAIAEVNVHEGKTRVLAVRGGRRAGKATASRKALVKATTENPDLTVLQLGPGAEPVIEKPVKGEVSRVE